MYCGVFWMDGDVVFSCLFYGVYIFEGRFVIGDYFYVLFYVDLLMYWVFMMSFKFGVECDIFNKDDYGNFFFVFWILFLIFIKWNVVELVVVICGGKFFWCDINVLVVKIYGLIVYD